MTTLELPEAQNNGTGWRRVLLKAFGFGAGFALICVMALAVWAWYSHRPKPAIPWNTHALTGHYEFATTQSDENRIVFVYTIQNNTKEDYRLDNSSNVELFEKLVSEDSIYRAVSKPPELHFPIFIPAGERTTIVIYEGFEYSGTKTNIADTQKYRDDVQRFIRDKHPNQGGFVLFDHIHKYQVELPKGW